MSDLGYRVEHRLNDILEHMPIYAIEMVISAHTHSTNDNLVSWLASNDDFIGQYMRHTDKFGVNFEGVKTAASLGNLQILDYAIKASKSESLLYENVVIAIIVGAARTINLRTIYWLDIMNHFKAIRKYTQSPCLIRDTALSTYNQIFIDKCLGHFKGCTSLLSDIRDFNLMIKMRQLSCGKLVQFPAGGIYTSEHLKHCESLTNAELRELFASCVNQRLLERNMRFARYFIDQCELQYPKLRIPFKSMLYVKSSTLIELFKGRGRLEADCVSCMFYNISYHRRGYTNDRMVNYDVIYDLLNAGFKWHQKFLHLFRRIALHKRELYSSGISALLVKHKKNKFIA
ncbi:hypothetical protein D5b_00357 [Faustovirus]|nr:hypothetical protein D5b_00357 [Faustovirus]AMN84556.1 hypothetical protein D6_00150 [Faustovirus]AMP44301.1 hypothetical protein PRJ_Dakar_00349 [Faustovirus]